MPYFCYICGEELTEKNKTEEHIILNALGGRLKSDKIICKTCNSKLGEKSDAKLAEDLSFFSDMLEIKRQRKGSGKPHSQIMTDKDNQEVIVEKAGEKLNLRKPYHSLEEKDDQLILNITARNQGELKGILNKYINDGVLTKEHVQEILQKAKISEHYSPLHKSVYISQEAFPSIIKSAVNFYVDQTGDIDRIKHLVPVITGEEPSKNHIHLYLMEKLPYPANPDAPTHMIHIQGSKQTGLLYALMEYFSLYTYLVILDPNYEGPDIKLNYTYDCINCRELNRDFNLPLSFSDIEAYWKSFSENSSGIFKQMEKRGQDALLPW